MGDDDGEDWAQLLVKVPGNARQLARLAGPERAARGAWVAAARGHERSDQRGEFNERAPARPIRQMAAGLSA